MTYLTERGAAETAPPHPRLRLVLCRSEMSFGILSSPETPSLGQGTSTPQIHAHDRRTPTAEADLGRHPGFSSSNVLAGGPGSLAVPLCRKLQRESRKSNTSRASLSYVHQVGIHIPLGHLPSLLHGLHGI